MTFGDADRSLGMYLGGVESTLRELETLLDRFDEPNWARTVGRLGDEAAASHELQAQSDVARRVLHLFQGGMSGFGDIVLQPNGRVNVRAQEELDALRSRVFEEARAAL